MTGYTSAGLTALSIWEIQDNSISVGGSCSCWGIIFLDLFPCITSFSTTLTFLSLGSIAFSALVIFGVGFGFTLQELKSNTLNETSG